MANNIVIKFELPQVVNATLLPLATSIGETLSAVWKGLTINIDTWYGKKQILKERNLQEFAKQIQNNLSSIPEKNLQEPKMNIIGPSLEASKHYFEEEWYRIMFANLIAGACDNRKNNNIHPCYVEIIKQLDNNDAKTLFKISKLPYLSTVEIRLNNQSYFCLFSEQLLDEDLEKHCISIENLKRLGLIDFNKSFRTISGYSNEKEIKESDSFKKIKSHFQKLDPNVSFSFNKATLTSFGKNFMNICI